MDYFKGKVALITGSSRGVGFATAKLLAERGAKIVLTARGEKRLFDSLSKLESIGAHARALAGDVSRYEDCQKMVNAAIDHYGRLDILVNNAGISMRGNFSDITVDVCRQVLETNLLGSVYTTKAALSYLSAAHGHLVFISSIAGLFGLPGASVYCSSKKALSGFGESLRLELSSEIHVGEVYLGFTEHDPEKRILAADGTMTLPDRPAHHTQQYAAELIVKLIERRRKRLIMTPVGKLGWFAYRLSPTLVEKAITLAMNSKLGIYKRFS